MNDFETWWHNEGSAPPLPGEDSEEHCKRMCQIAWSNGAFMENEACEKVCESTAPSQINGYECAALIRERGSREL